MRRKKLALQKPMEPSSKYHKIFGRFPAKPVEVELEPAKDPKEMICGMAEFFYSEGNPV